MCNSIYYFSGTGNSLYVAKRIQDHLGDTELIPIASSLFDNPITIETGVFGVVFPVHGWGPPRLVERFFKTMNIRQAESLVVVATHGGELGDTFVLVEDFYRRKGWKLTSGFDFRMPINYVVDMDPETGEDAQAIIEAAEPGMLAMLDNIAVGKLTPLPQESSAEVKLKTSTIRPRYIESLPTQDRHFSATNQCNGCGICERICPVQNIALNGEGKPGWRHRCEFCLACINWCPQQAIQYKEQTLDRERYHHPDIRASELMNRL